MTEERDPSELGAAVRRRPLSRVEEAELEKLVESSSEERILHYAGFAFDRDSSARPGDDVLIQRIALRSAAQGSTVPVQPAARRVGRRPRVVLLASVLAAAGTAVAGTGVLYVSSTREAPEIAPPAATAAPATSVSGARGARLAKQPPTPPRPSAEAPSSAPVPLRPAGRRDEPSDSKLVGAAALFEEANRSRLAGDTPRAVTFYRQLVERHPASAEAALAQLSLGKLLLAQGDAERALSAFRAGSAQRSALSAEALWGEAGALRVLGREREEHAVLERLLSRFPEGAYAGAARRRLGSSPP